MEKGLDLTLRLGLPSPTIETHLSLRTPTSDQGINVDGGRRDNNGRRHMLWGEDQGGRNNVDINIRVYNYIRQHFAGRGQTLNYAPYPMSLSPSPALATPSLSNYVQLDVPARRAQRNNFLAFANAANANAITNTLDTNVKWNCEFGGRRIEEIRKCTNINCNALSTPMWRRGPLGPKTLCNACGIKFRKEEGRRANRN